ncbi:B3 domain-containing protein Os01g0234100-like isoform X2 [Andrographis paniculata]|nr:B3 domain-containing protein Os01g0234100-like isoform X2 [Andrographis paniculata]
MEFKQGIQSNLSEQYPSFFKQLLKSHLSGKFYLGLPKKFCDAHLPSHDDAVILVNESNQEYTAKYSFRKHRLCCGWRCFSITHKLMEGDGLIFNLIESCKFRVCIIRSGRLSENNDGSLNVQTYDIQNCIPVVTAVKIENQTEEKTRTGENPGPPYKHINGVNGHHHEMNKARFVAQYGNTVVDHFTPDLPEGIRYPESTSVPGFEDLSNFKIRVDEHILDSEIPTNIRIKYYQLCCSQKTFLHTHLIKGLSCKFSGAMIIETVEISDAIRSSDLSTPLHQLECWDKTLKAFEDLGMTVGFLRTRLSKLISVLRESGRVYESKRQKTAQAYREIAATPINIESSMGSIAVAEVKVLKYRNEKLGLDFKELVTAPW